MVAGSPRKSFKTALLILRSEIGGSLFLQPSLVHPSVGTVKLISCCITLACRKLFLSPTGFQKSNSFALVECKIFFVWTFKVSSCIILKIVSTHFVEIQDQQNFAAKVVEVYYSNFVFRFCIYRILYLTITTYLYLLLRKKSRLPAISSSINACYHA